MDVYANGPLKAFQYPNPYMHRVVSLLESNMFLIVHLNHMYTVRSFSVQWNQPELEAKHRFIL